MDSHGRGEKSRGRGSEIERRRNKEYRKKWYNKPMKVNCYL